MAKGEEWTEIHYKLLNFSPPHCKMGIIAEILF
jgi:hypothetical protein